MRKTITYILGPLAGLVLCLSGCSVTEAVLPDGIESLFPNGDIVFKASNSDAPETKTVLQNDGSILWNAGDAINIFYGTSVNSMFTSLNTSPVAEVDFSGNLDGITYSSGGQFLAVYPFSNNNTSDGTTVTLTLAAEQKSPAMTFERGAFPSIARTKDRYLQFKNVCGGVRLSFMRDDIVKVVFEAVSEASLAGIATIGFDSDGNPVVNSVANGVKTITLTPSSGNYFEKEKFYYIVAYPAALPRGVKLTFTTGSGMTGTRTIDKNLAIKRSTWGTVNLADEGVEFEEPVFTFDDSGWYGVEGTDWNMVVDRTQAIYSYHSKSFSFTVFNPGTGAFMRVSGLPSSFTQGQNLELEIIQNALTSKEMIYAVSATVDLSGKEGYADLSCDDGSHILIRIK